MLRHRLFVVAALMIALTAAPFAVAWAGQVTVAVAANFTAAAKDIGAAFHAATGHQARFSFGSTGKLYAQILNGAPFDVFLAADDARPRQAVAEDLAVAGSLFPYAEGRLVLWSRTPDLATEAALRAGRIDRLALANPRTAPYGAAAVSVLEHLGLSKTYSGGRRIMGDNIAQTYQFVASGNADAGFIALAQIALKDGAEGWRVPADLHPPLTQAAVLLHRGADNPAAGAWLDFLRGPEARAIIERFGYGLPPGE